MTRPRVLFRADASHAIGFGHVARICALIEESVERGYEPVVLFGGDPPSVEAWTRARGLHVQARHWSTTEAIQACRDARVRAVVIDGPVLAAQLAAPLAAEGMPIVLVDDLGDLAQPCAAVVNHNFEAPALARTYPHAGDRLLGRRYLLLRRDIRRYTRGSCRPLAYGRLRVAITFGGSDPAGATVRTLCAMPSERPLELVTILGPAFHDDRALHQAIAAAREAGHVVDVRRAPDDPGALFATADAAICSAGGTLGELAYLGCPAIAFAIVPDQMATARAQASAGLVACGRAWTELDDETLQAELRAFLGDDRARGELRRRALDTADSEGPRRVCDALFA